MLSFDCPVSGFKRIMQAVYIMKINKKKGVKV